MKNKPFFDLPCFRLAPGDNFFVNALKSSSWLTSVNRSLVLEFL